MAISNTFELDGKLRSISIFGVYDGHGGNFAADFLLGNFHKRLLADPNLCKNPVATIRSVIKEIDEKDIL